MLNSVIMERTRFESVSANKSSDDAVTYGYRFSDDHSSEFADNLFIEDMSTDRLVFFKMLVDDLPASEDIGELFEFLSDAEKGITIDGEFFEWEDIKSLFKDTKYEVKLPRPDLDI